MEKYRLYNVVFEEPGGKYTWSFFGNKKAFENYMETVPAKTRTPVRSGVTNEEARKMCEEHNNQLVKKLKK